MATTRIMPLHVGKGRSVGTAIRDIIGYVENPEKTEQGQLVTGYQCNPKIADAEFLLFKQQYLQKTGRERGADDVIAYHLRQSFVPGEITPEEANRLGCELARRFTKGNNSYIVCTHTDRHHIHNHIIVSAVTLDHSRKFRNFWGSTKALAAQGTHLPTHRPLLREKAGELRRTAGFFCGGLGMRYRAPRPIHPCAVGSRSGRSA